MKDYTRTKQRLWLAILALMFVLLVAFGLKNAYDGMWPRAVFEWTLAVFVAWSGVDTRRE